MVPILAAGRSIAAKVAAAGLLALALNPTAAPAGNAQAPSLPTFGNPTISGIQGMGFEQDIRLDTKGRIYTSAPGGIGGYSFMWRSLDGGKTFKWVPAAVQPAGVLARLPECAGGGDTEIATDSQDRLYFNDLYLGNFATARSTDQGRSFPVGSCAAVATTPNDRQWYAVDGDPMAGGSITLTYNIVPNPTPVPNPTCQVANRLVFARSPISDLPAARELAGIQFGPPQILNPDNPCDEGIMGNDEVFDYGSVKRVFVMHNNDALNQIRMGRCDLVPFTQSTTGYANCVDKPVVSTPAAVNGGDFPTLTIDRAGNLFAVWEEAPCGPCPGTITGDTLLYYSVSIDQGNSWSGRNLLPTGPLKNNVFAWPAAGDKGRVDVAFYGTPAPAVCCKGPDSTRGDWSLYLVQSLDFTSATPTWTPPILAGEHFIHRGTIQTLMGGQKGDRTLGDFLQMRIGVDGEANISYADSNSRTEVLVSQGMYVRQNGGSGVFANRPVVNGSPLRFNSVTMGRHNATLDIAGVSTSNLLNLEILGSQISMSDDRSQYRIKMAVADLRSLAAPVAGGTLVWSAQWKVPSATDPDGGKYFHAYMESMAGAEPTFWVGENALQTNGVGATLTYPGSMTVTGTVSRTAPGMITINVPLSSVGEVDPISPILYSVTASTMSLAGTASSPAVIGPIGGTPFNLVDVAPAYDYDPRLPTPPFQVCHPGDGKGSIQGQRSGTATFTFDEDPCEDGDPESVQESDPGSGTDFQSTSITGATFDDLTHSLTMVGIGTNAGRPVAFTMVAVDNGPGLPGLFSLTLSDGYSVRGSLLAGSIQLR
jgi:hypothetical protein